MKQIILTVCLVAVTLYGFSQSFSIKKDLKYFEIVREKIGQEQDAFKKVKSKMVVYYSQSDNKKLLTNRLLKNAEGLKKDPEGYVIHLLVAFELLQHSKDRLRLTKMIHAAEGKLRQIKNKELLFHTENLIGAFYGYLGKSKESQKFKFRALQHAVECKDTLNIQIIQYNIASTYFFNEEYSKAEKFLRRAIYLEQFGYNKNHYEHMMALALILEKGHGKVREAIRIYKDIEQLVPEEKKGGFYNNLGNLLLINGDYHSAEKQLLMAVDYFNKSEDVNAELAYINLANCYSKLNNFERAHHFLLLKDSVVNVQNREKHVALLEQLKKQELVKIRKLESKNALTKLAYEKSKSLSILFFLVFVLILLLLAIWLVIYMRRKIKMLVRINLNSMERSPVFQPEYKAKKKASPELIEKIDIAFNELEVYKDPEISIHKLAALLETNVTELSQAINIHYNVSFRTLINAKRIELAKIMLIEKKYENYSMAGIAETVGYLNNSSFYKHFREITGVTPANFKSYGLLILDEETKKEDTINQICESSEDHSV